MNKLFISNWKMNLTVTESVDFSNEISRTINENIIKDNIEIIICPPFISIPYCFQILKSVAKIGSQDVSKMDEAKGAFTGEISAKMISDYSDYVIIGHSERRINLKETNQDVALKGINILKNNMTPILCIGETAEQRKTGEHISLLIDQLNESSQGLGNKMVVAYEPIWAIGSGNSCSTEQIIEVSREVKAICGDSTPFVYGGSVNEDNCKELLYQKEIDGVLVGSASLSIGSFKKMVSSINSD
ncbi:MAG: triose-phosphate isomerase [Chloroflexota bacterium]|nr:triose-phosphate isomerase [Chloroflexota bacterium]